MTLAVRAPKNPNHHHHHHHQSTSMLCTIHPPFTSNRPPAAVHHPPFIIRRPPPSFTDRGHSKSPGGSTAQLASLALDISIQSGRIPAVSPYSRKLLTVFGQVPTGRKDGRRVSGLARASIVHPVSPAFDGKSAGELCVAVFESCMPTIAPTSAFETCRLGGGRVGGGGIPLRFGDACVRRRGYALRAMRHSLATGSCYQCHLCAAI